jgi:hypothetical protein
MARSDAKRSIPSDLGRRVLRRHGHQGFLFSSHFIDGGVTGISMLLSKVDAAAAGDLAAAGEPAVRRAGLPPPRARVRGPERLAIARSPIVLATVPFPT